MTLERFQNVPRESEIDHTFSPKFQERMAYANKKSQSVLWRFWQKSGKWVIILAVLTAVSLAAVPIVRHTVLMSSRPHIPQVTKTYYIPTLDPEGFTLLYRDRYRTGVVYTWQNENGDSIQYRQTTDDRYLPKTEAENTITTTKTINGFSVEIEIDETNHTLDAVWTDDQYIYLVDIHLSEADPYPVFETLMNSLVAVGAVD